MTNTPAPATSSCAILASDFSSSTTDVLRHRWTLGKMRHVVAALDGRPVAIITDRQTGSAEVGVRLVRVQTTGDRNPGARVVVERTHDDGTTSRTNFLLDMIGETIIPLAEPITTKGAKWVATDSVRVERSAAIRLAQAEHGEVEGRGWGAWTATADADGVYVTYTPHTGNDHFAEQWGTRGGWHYSVAQLAELATI